MFINVLMSYCKSIIIIQDFFENSATTCKVKFYVFMKNST